MATISVAITNYGTTPYLCYLPMPYSMQPILPSQSMASNEFLGCCCVCSCCYLCIHYYMQHHQRQQQ